jgi:hypothetical protein
MAELKKYEGSCHCGKVHWQASIDLAHVMDCNCSYCQRKGVILAFIPSESFKLLKGEDALTEYKFNRKVISHVFCSTCGVQSFAHGKKPDGSPMVAINVRCIPEVDPWKLNVTHYDGKNS